MELQEVAQQLFFIFGCARSGTTLCQAMLSSHPEVAIPDETCFYSRVYKDNYDRLGELTTDNWQEALKLSLEFYRIQDLQLDPSAIKAKCLQQNPSWETIFLAILALYAEKQGVKRVGEKTPRHIAYIERLQRVFPQARFIYLVRDPRAVVLSLMNAPFGSRRIGNSCNLWLYGHGYHQGYRNALGDRYKIVRYEDLVTQPESTLREICQFLSLQFSPQMLQFHRRKELGFNKRDFQHMSNTLKPLFTSSVDKWREELSSAQIAIVQSALGKEMQEMGYEPVAASTVLPYVQYKLDVWSETLGNRLRKIRK